MIGYAKLQDVDVHISTQLNVTNIETVKFYSLFANVMVLSRELSLRQVKEICDGVIKEDVRGPNGELIKIEVFGHGALCMAVSGKCYLSLHTTNSSANRGACVQNCRRKYKVIDLEDGHELELDNEYIMSPKSLFLKSKDEVARRSMLLQPLNAIEKQSIQFKTERIRKKR